jgi:hypothetical protein
MAKLEHPSRLEATWRLRNTVVSSLEQILDDLQRQVQESSFEELVEFLDGFFPGRAPRPEWTASLERFAELLWAWLPAETMAKLEAEYAGRTGPIWEPVAHKFGVENGEALAARRWQPHDARRFAIVLR